VLRMLSGVNSLVVRVRDRKELLGETCRLAVTVGGYATAIVHMKTPGSPELQPTAWSGADDKLTEALRTALATDDPKQPKLIDRVIRSGKVFGCNDTSKLDAPEPLKNLLTQEQLLSIIALPLLVDNTAIGVLVLTARESGAISEEELRMLRDVSGNL